MTDETLVRQRRMVTAELDQGTRDDEDTDLVRNWYLFVVANS